MGGPLGWAARGGGARWGDERHTQRSGVAEWMARRAETRHSRIVDRAGRAGSPKASSSGVSCGELIATKSLTSSAISGRVEPAVYVAFPVKGMGTPETMK